MSIPQWYAGQVITADRMNARNVRYVSQNSDMAMVNQGTPLATEIVIPVEAGAVYYYNCLISYSARSGSANCLGFSWDAPSGTVLARFTISTDANGNEGASNTPNAMLTRRPANTTQVPAGGTSDENPPANFQSAYDQGTITVGSTGGNVVLMVRQNVGGGSPSATNQTILRGGNQTRCFFQRIA